jgi:carboxypeptidase PM20D1
MLNTIAPAEPFGPRLVLANLWLFRPPVVRQLLGDPKMATLVRTTTAPTIFKAGNTENVLPSEAKAVVNFQILPGDTVDGVLERVKAVIADPTVGVRLLPTGAKNVFRSTDVTIKSALPPVTGHRQPDQPLPKSAETDIASRAFVSPSGAFIVYVPMRRIRSNLGFGRLPWG